MGAEDQAVDVDDEEVQIVEPPLRQGLQGRLAGVDELPADAGLRDAHRLGHLRQDLAVGTRRDPVHEDLQDPLPEPPVGLQRRVGRHLDLRPDARPLPTQPRLLEAHPAVRERHDAPLPAVPPVRAALPG